MSGPLRMMWTHIWPTTRHSAPAVQEAAHAQHRAATLYCRDMARMVRALRQADEESKRHD